MRIIKHSQENIIGNSSEMFFALLILLFFALIACLYVLHEGIKRGKQTTYELIIKCVLIITSIIPPTLPMQLSISINTAIMNLTRKGIFCTEPYKLPSAGKINLCVFDKTGTITSDELSPNDVLN